MREKYNIDKDIHKLFSKEEIDRIIGLLKFYKNQIEGSVKELTQRNFFMGLNFLTYNNSGLYSNYDPLIEKLEVLKKYT
jgi:hypothetical protein